MEGYPPAGGLSGRIGVNAKDLVFGVLVVDVVGHGQRGVGPNVNSCRYGTWSRTALVWGLGGNNERSDYGKGMARTWIPDSERMRRGVDCVGVEVVPKHLKFVIGILHV